MPKKILLKKPLVEAIFELRWSLQGQGPEGQVDPDYKLLIGALYERIKGEFGYHEALPTSIMPDEVAAYIIQHRFRAAEGKYPLIQLGPGIVTLNETDGYVWEDFQRQSNRLTAALFEAHPRPDKLTINNLTLRYIDAIPFDYESQDIFQFLREEMKIDIGIHDELFRGTGVNRLPSQLDLRFTFPTTKPSGSIVMRFLRGRWNDKDSLIWETVVQTPRGDVQDSKGDIADWLEVAHGLTHDWFFKIIEGELEARFEPCTI